MKKILGAIIALLLIIPTAVPVYASTDAMTEEEYNALMESVAAKEAEDELLSSEEVLLKVIVDAGKDNNISEIMVKAGGLGVTLDEYPDEDGRSIFEGSRKVTRANLPLSMMIVENNSNTERYESDMPQTLDMTNVGEEGYTLKIKLKDTYTEEQRKELKYQMELKHQKEGEGSIIVQGDFGPEFPEDYRIHLTIISSKGGEYGLDVEGKTEYYASLSLPPGGYQIITNDVYIDNALQSIDVYTDPISFTVEPSSVTEIKLMRSNADFGQEQNTTETAEQDETEAIELISESETIWEPVAGGNVLKHEEEKKQIPIWIIIAGAALIIGLIGYIAYRIKKKKEREEY